MSTYKDLLREVFWYLIAIIFWFGLAYWLATENLWLCLFLSYSIASCQFVYRNVKREIFEALLPIQYNIDDNINTLHRKCETLEEEVEDLKDKLKDLESKFDELNEQVNPSTY